MFGPFNYWGNPHADRPPDTFEVGDKAYVKSHVPLYGGHTGKVISIDADGFISLQFGNGATCGFEPDDLVNKGK